jgi:hypothetical protein
LALDSSVVTVAVVAVVRSSLAIKASTVPPLPVIAFFGFRWLRRAPWQAVMVLVVQGLALAAAAVIPVFVLGW